MNLAILMGRLTRDPQIMYTQGEETKCIARYSIAIDRAGENNGADFINCAAFGKNGEFVEKYLHKGMKIAVEGRIQTGSYTDKDGTKRYTTEVIVSKHHFCEKAGSEAAGEAAATSDPMFDEIAKMAGGIDDEVPFK